jgi:hypothetical protein
MPKRVFKRQSVFVTDELAIAVENIYKKLFSLALSVHCAACGWISPCSARRHQSTGRWAADRSARCVGLATTCWMPLWKLSKLANIINLVWRLRSWESLEPKVIWIRGCSININCWPNYLNIWRIHQWNGKWRMWKANIYLILPLLCLTKNHRLHASSCAFGKYYFIAER